MPLTYTSYIAQIANMMPISPTDANFITMAPGMIDYAEQRIYRELDPLRVQVTDASAVVSSGVRDFVLPTTQGIYVIVDNINIISPSSLSIVTGSRVQLTPTSREFIDIAYPTGATATGVPEFWAMASDTQVIFGPAPDAGYIVEIIGVQRPQPLSVSNTSTYLTQYVPDLFVAASMIFVSAFMRDFGPQSDQQQMSVSWEKQYQTLFQSASIEQLRAKGQSEAWGSDQPNPIATPKRV